MSLSETWFVEGYIDFELQKYKLLAYLKEVQQCFSESRLYPGLSDVIFHYNNIVSFSRSKQLLQDRFPQRLDQVNAQRLELIYKKMLADDDLMKELENIAHFAIESMKETIDDGTQIYDFVEKQLHIEPVGIVPLYKNEGYMLLRYGTYREIRAYQYTITLFEQQAARYKGIRISYLKSWQSSIVYTSEMIKREIIRSNPALPNPAVYSVDTALRLPLDETLLPIAKRMLIRHISNDAA
ncbi:hypothetical protein ACTHGU_19585 [Chitinophagaceae bacterium MMS25-I14]